MNACREDLADLALAGRVIANAYVRPRSSYCVTPREAMRAKPDTSSAAVSELLHGEEFAVLETSAGWAWGYSRHDGYVGYVPVGSLDQALPPTHRVPAAALIFEAADIKSLIIARLPAFAKLHAEPTDNAPFFAAAGGFVHARHVQPVDHIEPDPVAVAETLVGTPYLWGGRSGDGLDCSGLVQQVLACAGIAAPRDSDQQQALGAAIADPATLKRGDLVFFPGHVGIMADTTRLAHANAYWMAVTVEPLADVVARLSDHPQPITAMRRI